MKRAALVFIPTPGMGHLLATVEIAKLLVQRDDRLSITVIIMKLPLDSKIDTYTQSLASSSSISSRIQFILLPSDDLTSDQLSSGKFFGPLMEANKPRVKEIVSNLAQSTPIAGVVLDIFCTPYIDVANQFGVPSYVFFTSGAAFLDFMFQIQLLHDEQELDPTQLKGTDADIALPSFAHPLPAKVLPSVILNKDWLPDFLDIIRKFRETKGIMVNTQSNNSTLLNW